MAKDLYNGPLNRDMDFTDPIGTGAPASGLAVQNYIKKIDGDKYGAAFVDNENNCLFFATTEDMEEYKLDPSDPEKQKLIKGSVEMGGEPKYRIVTTITEPENNYAAVFYGSKGNYIRYTFETVDRDGQRFLEAVDATYVIQNNGASTTVRESYHVGASVAFNVDKYLLEGNNDVTITLVGQVSKVSKIIGVRFQAINISLSDHFDISNIYTTSSELTVSGTVTGSGTRYFEWYIDGVQQPSTSADTIVSVGDAEYTRKLDITGLASGRHNIQYRAYIEAAGGDRFYTNTMYRDFVIDDQLLSGVTILTKFESPNAYGILDPFTQPIPLHGPTQYEIFNVGYAIYSKTNRPSESLSVTLGTKESTFSVRNNVEYNYEIREFTDGEKALVFSCLETTLSYNATIEESDYDLKPITDTQFEFSGGDRTNDSSKYDKSHWSFGDYTGTLTGFNWTESSGWVDGKLVVPGGARFDTNYAPYATEAKTNGFTFEIEFSTTHVLDETVPIIDLRSNGHGLLITASEIIFSSRGNVTVNTKYKPDENVRAAIVVTPTNSGTYPGFIFIYIDGVLTGAITYTSNDSFVSDTTLSIVGSNDAIVSIKQIRTYTKALTSDNILDNFILYRDTVAELVDAYDRNNIYAEGTKHISDDKLAAYTPIIVITGNVNKLQNFGKEDKKTYVKMDKIEVINMADPTKNMTLINPSMRCQGTSSMEYPRKNFRFYTQADSKDETVDPYTTQMFDWQGNELTGKQRLYSFKDNAQPVKCWCLKADYAESSSTHNTGVARMWNDYMKNARVAHDELDDRYYLKDVFPTTNTPCKTIAQHLAEDNHFEYDVRTTVNGFPITLFFHEHEGEPLTFLGRYNWNNDKSTESVYGFKDIPGFEPYKNTMECWEVVNGDKVCNLFTDLTNWNNGKGMTGGWYDSFEARYPDDHDEPTETERATGRNSALKKVAVWINSTMGASKVSADGKSMVVDNQELMDIFSEEKWDHLDVYKVAAYYVYLMRFGAVDQTVKNAMFTTEDGVHWFYINYDNDTINGVENSGALTLGYDIDRQSPVPGTAGSYCYAGHNSVLWNNLEADADFMSIVRKIDNALFKVGLNYAGVIDMFNNQQSAKWSERTHNEDYAYKYLDIDDRTQLSKLQGPRKSHRQWWLSHRFAIYDAIFGTESYLNNRISVKPVTSTDDRTGQYVSVTPAVDNQIFGYGYQNPVTTGVHGEKDVPIEFDMVEDYYEGTTIKFFNAVYFKEIDFSKISKYVKEIDFTLANSAAFDTQLTSLVMGDMSCQDNTNMTKIENLNYLKYLENIQMCNYKGFNKIDLTGNKYLKTLDFRNCTGLSSIELPVAAPITTIHYPYSINSIVVKDLLSLNNIDIQLDSNQKQFVYDLKVENCPALTSSPTFLLNWIDTRDSSIQDTDCTVYMDNVAWDNISMQNLMKIAHLAENAGFGDGQRINFRGYASVGRIDNVEDAYYLMSVFGDSVFDKSSAFYIDAEKMIFLTSDKNSTVEGSNIQFYGIVVGGAPGAMLTYSIVQPQPSGVRLDSTTGLLSTDEGPGARDVTVRLRYLDMATGEIAYSDPKTVSILAATYPSTITITGNQNLEPNVQNHYTLSYSDYYTGEMRTEWEVTGDLVDGEYISVNTIGENELVVTLDREPAIDVMGALITARIYKKNVGEHGTLYKTSTLSIAYQNRDIAISRLTNPYLMDVMVNNNLINPENGDTNDKMTRRTAMSITAEQLNPGSSRSTSIFYNSSNFRTKCTSFNEFKYFLSVDYIPSNTFEGWTAGTSIEFPITITQISSQAFYGCSNLLSITIPASVTTINSNAFYNCTKVESVIFEGCPSTIAVGSFPIGSSLTHVTFNNNVPNNILYTGWSSCPFYGCTNINTVTINEGCTSIGEHSFRGLTNLSGEITFPSTLRTIGQYAFYGCSNISIIFNEGLTSIGPYAFQSCTGLTGQLVLPSTLATIGQHAFCFDTGLTGLLNIPEGVNGIGQGAFYGDTGLTSVILPSTLVTINAEAFLDCTGLTHVTFNGNVPNYALCISSNNSPFRNCTGLNNEGVVTIGENCHVIGDYAFKDCSWLSFNDINFNILQLQSINQYAFYGCTGLVGSLNISEGLTAIGQYAFQGCTGLTSLTLPSTYPNGVTTATQPFRDCTGLTHVTFNGNVPNYALCTTSTNSPFYRCDHINSMSIGNGCTEIGMFAFKLCEWITGILNLPEGLVKIGQEAFRGTKITGINFPSTLTRIDTGVFEDCTELTSVTIPSNVTTMYYEAFKGCTSLTSVTLNCNIPNSCFDATDSGAQFANCPNINSITIGEGCKSIGSQAFKNCTQLTGALTIPEGVTTIAYQAFYGCTGIDGDLTLPSTLTTLNGQAFYGCINMTGDITIAGGVNWIGGSGGEKVFYNCRSLNSVVISQGVTTIGSYSFQNCTGLQSISIPASVTLLTQGAFDNTQNLSTITIDANNTTYEDGGEGGNCIIRKSNHHLIVGCKGTVIPNTVTQIEEYAFKGSRITSINIPASVISIYGQAFAYCRQLASMTVDYSNTVFEDRGCNCIISTSGNSINFGCKNTNITGAGVKELLQYAFKGSGITSINIPASITKIYETTFNDCDIESITIDPNNTTYEDGGEGANCIIRKLDKLLLYGCKNSNIPTGVTSISNYAFQNCTGLVSITIPGTSTVIGGNAFSGCTSLETLILSEGVTTLSQYAFDGCTGLTSITIPSSITSFSNYAFRNCTGLTHITFNCNIPNDCLNITSSSSQFFGCKNINSITLGAGCTSIGSNAFQGCTWLSLSTIPSTITSIGISAFQGCTGITISTLPSTITSLGVASVFYGCTGITSMNIYCEITSIGSSLFQNCTGLTSVDIPATVNAISSQAFSGCSSLGTITVRSITPPTFGTSSLPSRSVVQHIYVPAESVSAYQAASGWNTYAQIIEAIPTP